ncbi:MAG TPA: OsmC family protein [Spirochaetota bacterium]|nr:OsmC family protein [Spirochaetota bacterium]
MKVTIDWKEKMQFEASNDANAARMAIDITDPELGGEGKGQSPKQMFLQSLAGCTGMDIIHIMKKMRAALPAKFSLEVSGETVETEPKVFTKIHLVYHVEGDVDAGKLMKAVNMSQDTYCSIGAMVKKVCDYSWEVYLNGNRISPV